ncbi:hypothetical protein D9M72_498170 [compost metagenome]
MLLAEEPRLRRCTIAHCRELEEFAAEQIAVDQKEGDEIDARNEQQEERQQVAEDDNAEKLQRSGDRLAKRQRPALRLARIVPLLDHLGNIVEEEAGDQRGDGGQKQSQGERQPEAREDADDEGQPTGPDGRARHQRIDPRQRQPDEHFAHRKPERDERQYRQAQHLPENRSGLGRKEIGKRKSRRVQDHHRSPVWPKVR